MGVLGLARPRRKRSRSWSWRAVGAAATLAALGTTAALPGAQAEATSPREHVIVSVTAGAAADAAAVVERFGGAAGRQFAVAGAIEADLPASAVAALANNPMVSITPDAQVSFADAATAAPGRAPAAVFPQTTGASGLAAQGINGAGVNVAVLDTGIDPLPDFANRLVGGVDLSGEGNPFLDSYGHGTFVAGLIAGDGTSSAGTYMGEAPGAGLVAVKVAGASGGTDMATVLSGIQWVVNNQSALNIRVLNLSLGMVPTMSSISNPLDRAVEAAWKQGVVVVVSAGNAGPFNGTILSPADDPLVITVGAVDDQGTASTADDTSAAFSSVGPTPVDGWIKPDLVASGRSVVSLRAPGSTVDVSNPSAVIGTGNFVGSGTSFSAAITSGAAALVVQSRPNTEPNRVKARLLGTTMAGPTGNPFVDGHGSLNAAAAVATTPAVLQQYARPWSAPAVGTTISLPSTWQLSSWSPANWSGLNPGGTSWSGSSWNSVTWTGSMWSGSSWNGSSWNGSSWNGSSWNGSSWNGFTWSGSSWNGSSWNGSSWNGSSWNGSSWNGSSWNGSSWNGAAWNGSSWNGSSWN